ncbi:lipid-A-disaccharide synthase [Campylobacter sp. FMV-PI01]|uniref:Lipid-A-disaccharide synthase n=1 Tax=Campylobacter portucalensis TaxID=2608384 RepID=A0A6L5WH07_9BACT|nr:lipid-A-disaccharide synthase [Campylobacter portucalensis]MSN95652.1 lipid-A-disaccharide synthase [Campylobacter portucalensis]
MKNILVSCLEPSANLHLSGILKFARNYKLEGIFDPKFGKPLISSSEFCAMGFVEVLPLIFKAKKAIKNMVNLAKNSDEILLIDSPAFNLPLAKAIKKAGIKTKITYYILPQVWAWKKNRVKKVEKYCDNLASILPFDSKFYNKSKFVGHPLLDEINYQKTSYKKNKIISFLPGSRKSEISRLMPIFRELTAKFDGFKKLLVVPLNLKDCIDEIYGDVSKFEVVFDTKTALLKSEFAFICSGTATLEAALIGTPFVLCYKAKAIDIFIAKRVVNIKYAGLANIMYDFMGRDPFHKELIQNDVTLQNLYQAYVNCNPNDFLEASQVLKQYLKFGSALNMVKILNL